MRTIEKMMEASGGTVVKNPTADDVSSIPWVREDPLEETIGNQLSILA